MNDGNETSKLEMDDSTNAATSAAQTGPVNSTHGGNTEPIRESVDEESSAQSVEEAVSATYRNEPEEDSVAPSQLVPEEGFQGEEGIPQVGEVGAEAIDDQEDDEGESAPREMIEAEHAVQVSHHVPEDTDRESIDNGTVDHPPVASSTPDTEESDVRPQEIPSVDARKTEANGTAAPTETTVKEAAQSNGDNVSISINKKLLIRVGIGIVAVLALVGIIIAVSNSNKEKAATDAFNSYVTQLKSTEMKMVSGGATAESIGNDVKRIWNAAIFEKYKSGWDTDIQKYYNKDFNTAIEKYYSDNSSKVSSLKNSKDDVAESMKKLASPPDGCETAYATITDLYDNYNTLVNLAISPTGNLQSYSSSFNAADTGFVNTMNKLDTQIPEQK